MGCGDGIRKATQRVAFHPAFADSNPYCVLVAVSLCAPSLVAAGLEATELAGLAAGEFAELALCAGAEGSGVLLVGAGTVVGLLVAGGLTDDGRGLRELAGTAGVAGVEGAALGAGTLFGGVDTLALATLFAGAFTALPLSSRGGAPAGLGASSTAGRASATIAGFSSPFELATTAGDAVDSPTFAGGATSAIVFPSRW